MLNRLIGKQNQQNVFLSLLNLRRTLRKAVDWKRTLGAHLSSMRVWHMVAGIHPQTFNAQLPDSVHSTLHLQRASFHYLVNTEQYHLWCLSFWYNSLYGNVMLLSASDGSLDND